MDLFILPYNDLFIIYSPLKKLAFLVNKSVIHNLKYRLKEKESRGITQNNQQILDFLEAAGIFEPVNLTTSRPNSDTFSPTGTTLFLSNKCNLRCIYCYASAGEKPPATMPWKIAKTAVDFIIKNAVAVHEKNVQIGFHGGGEPMLSWRLMKQIVEYFIQSATKSGLHPSVHSATNGLLSPKKLKWIIDNFTSLNISLDGLPEIQNNQRPLVDGRPSFNSVWATIKTLDKYDFPYGIRATVTAESVTQMGAFAKFVVENSKCQRLHFEPSFGCVRCSMSGMKHPKAEDFIEGYRNACIAASGYLTEIMYSGARFQTLSERFCEAAGGSFCITPKGDVTSCFEVTESEDPRSRTFFYGKFNDKKGTFDLFPDKLIKLFNRTVFNIEQCNNCFCKYHCSGDCITRTSDGIDLLKINDFSRCKINQALTLDQIIDKLI